MDSGENSRMLSLPAWIIALPEEAIQDLEGIEEITSISSEGVASVMIEVDSGYDPRELAKMFLKLNLFLKLIQNILWLKNLKPRSIKT